MSRTERLLDIVDAMSGKRVVVFGDLVADRFIYATPRRISREAPVLILREEKVETVPGGGGNAIANIASLGGRPLPVSIVGSGRAGTELRKALEERDIDCSRIRTIDGYESPSKTRILAGLPHAVRQQIVRLDADGAVDLDSAQTKELVAALEEASNEADAAIISDYGYGVADPSRIENLLSRGIPVTLDSRYRLLDFTGVTAATPNEEEASEAAHQSLFDIDEQGLESTGKQLLASLGSEALLITRGSQGMVLFEKDRPDFETIPVFGSDQIADVTGAGDTVTAAFTLALAAGASFGEAALLSNYAGGLVVMKMGTATVTRAELESAILARNERDPG